MGLNPRFQMTIGAPKQCDQMRELKLFPKSCQPHGFFLFFKVMSKYPKVIRYLARFVITFTAKNLSNMVNSGHTAPRSSDTFLLLQNDLS